MSTKTEHIPVPVSEAQRIAETYRKSVVIISAWDPISGLLHTTTYGSTEEEKHWAAKGGELTAQALGTDMKQANYYEDFRKPKP